MFNKNTKKGAFLSSLVALILCCSMFVGTTFAWFTDEVESGRNLIAAGNLDVELYANGEQVTGETVLFDDVTPNLWEPGAVAYENLQVKNVGSLALQYSLTLNVLNETIVNGYKLSDVIKVGIVEGGVSGKTRDEVVEAVDGNWTKLANFKFNQDAVKLEAGKDTLVYGVVLYWQPNDNEVDNHYNMNNENQGNKLKLEIGVSLVATQVMHEEDSFGEDYDEEATPWIGAIDTDWYFKNPDATEFNINTVAELAGLAAIVNGTATAPVVTYSTESENTVQDSFAGKTIILGADIDLAYSTWTPIGNSTYKFQGTFNGAKHTISNLKVTGHGSNVGLFGYTTNGEIKDLTVENASVSGRLNVGVVAGTPYTSKYTNITVTGDVEVNGMAYVGGVGGKNAYADWTDITVTVNEGSYVKATSTENGDAYRSYVGGVIGFNGEGSHTFKNISSNIDVIGDVCDIGGVFGIAHYGNSFENITCTGNVSCTGEADEIGGIAGVWNNKDNTTVSMTSVSFTGTVSDVNGTVFGCDIVGAIYSSSNSGTLTVNGTKVNAVSSAEELTAALTAGGYYYLASSISLTDTSITVPAGVSATLDLNGNTISGTYNGTKNQEMFLVKGNLTVIGEGAVTMTATQNQGWNAMATIFDVTAGGVLNMEGVTADVGGTDMNFIVHLNNWGEVTLNVNNCDFTTTYVAVRAFNSGYDMNNVTIKNTDFHGGRVFWVHNYIGDLDSTKHTDEAIKARLNLNIYGNSNTTDHAKPVRFGFNNSTYYTIDGAPIVNVSNATELATAVANGGIVTLTEDINVAEVLLISGDTVINGNGNTLTTSATRGFRVTAGDVNVTLNDVVIETSAVGAYNNDARGISVDGNLSGVTVTLNNCTVDFADGAAADWAYGVNISGSTTNSTIIINGGYYEGANVINVWGTGNTVVIDGATLNCTYGDNASYHGAGVRLNPGCTADITVKNTTVTGTNAVVFCACGVTEGTYTYTEKNIVDTTTTFAQ